ncbi:TIGR02611 family protein [Microbacterium lacus]|uniref:TIGR02611 family protein n=1 Tax=Microbacterium lacus TaxID=415217 RepID=A0ABN2G197_9MICO
MPSDQLPSQAEQDALWGGEHLSDDLERTVRSEIEQGERADQPVRRMLRRLRNRVGRHPRLERLYKAVVAVIGGTLTVLGLLLVPLPGPGWLVVFLGLAVLGTEFHWARRIATWLKRQLDRFWAWWKDRRARRRAAQQGETA